MEGRRSCRWLRRVPPLRARVSIALVVTVCCLVMLGLQPAVGALSPGAAPPDAVSAGAVQAPAAPGADTGDPASELALTGSADATPWIVGGALATMLLGAALVFLTAQPVPVLVEMRSLRPIEPLSAATPRASRRRRRR